MKSLKTNISQYNIQHGQLRTLVDLSKVRGENLHYAYRCALPNSSLQTDVAAGIGLMALADAVQASIPVGIVTPALGRFVYAALGHLSSDLTSWRVEGAEEKTAAFKQSFAAMTEPERKRWFQRKTGIAERGEAAFMVFSKEKKLIADGGATAVSAATSDGFSYRFDAVRYAETLKRALPGALFICEVL